eukprot:11213547-Lingulodinium_polyedra.AAC.1
MGNGAGGFVLGVACFCAQQVYGSSTICPFDLQDLYAPVVRSRGGMASGRPWSFATVEIYARSFCQSVDGLVR